jgi:hypothetical protein
MHRTTGWGAAVLAAMLLTACGAPHTVVAGGDGSFSVRDGQVVLQGAGGTEATIAADGSFSIGGKPVVITDAQRASFVRYHAHALEFVEHARQTGKAGAAVGVAAVREVARGLASGETSKIGEKIEAETGAVKVAAGRLCEDLAGIVELQGALSAELAAFRPYAVVEAEEPGRCRKDLAEIPGKG